MLPYMGGQPGNASSLHRWGRSARAALDRAREQVAALIGAEPEEIVFTSGGTESNNLALGAAGNRRLLYSVIEHPSIQRPASRRVAQTIPVDAEGRVDMDALRELLRVEPALVSVIAGNNETGVINDPAILAALCAESHAIFHTDATQYAWLLPLQAHAPGLAMATLSAHKLGGPQGVGALYIRRDVSLEPLLLGGTQERRRRAGTENLAGIVGMGEACARALDEYEAMAARLAALRDQMERALVSHFPTLRVNSALALRLPHVLNVSADGIEGDVLVRMLDSAGVAASTGSACSSGLAEASPVLLAMGRTHGEALGSLRFSLGWNSTATDVATTLPRIISTLQEAGLRPH
ncbi:MAG: hypothetical protein RLZZ303_1869 [Candidatus Hydrogenedentota bacterium]